MIQILQTLAHPADSAFVAGRLELPTEPSSAVSAALSAAHWDDSVFLMILGLVLLVAAILLTQKYVGLFPSLIGCMFRYKECINIEDSAKLSRDRNIVFTYSIFPFVLVCSVFKVYDPAFMADMSLVVRFFVTLAIFVAYIGLGHVMISLLKPKSMSKKDYAPISHSFGTFFISIVLFTLPLASLFAIFGAPDNLVRAVILWVTAILYAIYLIRKIQILGHRLSLFTTFLYLCALEFLPTGLLITSALIF